MINLRYTFTCSNLKGPICGISMMLAAQIAFTIAWALVKKIGHGLPVFEMVFFRAIISLIVLIPIAKIKGVSILGNNKKLLIIRGALGFVGITCSFYALANMGFGEATLLTNTAPIFVAMFSPFILKEKTSKRLFAYIIIAFCGIIMILSPTGNMFNWTAAAPLLAGLSIALTSIVIRVLHKTDRSMTITLYFTAFIAIASAPFVVYNYVAPTTKQWMTLTAIAMLVTIGQLLITKSFSFAQPNIISPFSYVSVIIAYILGLILWNEGLHILSTAGALLVISSCIAILQSAKKDGIVEVTPVNVASTAPCEGDGCSSITARRR